MLDGVLASPPWIRSVRLERGREVVTVHSPDGDGDDDPLSPSDGVMLAPGEATEIRWPVSAGDVIHYELSCDDGLDIGIEAWVIPFSDGATVVVEPWARNSCSEGTLEMAVSGMCTVTLDNRHSWLRGRNVHATFERISNRTRDRVPPSATAGTHAAEEILLRRSYVASLHAEEQELCRRAARLRRQLESAESELERVRRVISDANAYAEPEPEAKATTALAHAPEALDCGATCTDSSAASVDAPVEDEKDARSVLWALWRRLAQLDAHVLLDAQWVDYDEATAAGAADALLLREVTLHGCSFRPLDGTSPALLTPGADVEHLASMCLQQFAQLGPRRAAAREAGGEASDPASPSDARRPASVEQAAAETSETNAAPEQPTSAPLVPAAAPRRDGDGSASAGSSRVHRSDDRDGGSGLERLQLLSQLLLELDEAASIDVSESGPDAYEVHAVSLRGRALREGFGMITCETNVRRLADAIDKATMIGCEAEQIEGSRSSGQIAVPSVS